jgi:parallel beta-helix repeat protein
MKKISGILATLVLMLSLCFPAIVPAIAADTTWYVDTAGTDAPGYGTGTGSSAFATIQYAVNAASAGDTITVSSGTYNDNITITKSLTVRSAAGAASTTVNSTDGNSVFLIGADNVTIEGFTVKGATTATKPEYIFLPLTTVSLPIISATKLLGDPPDGLRRQYHNGNSCSDNTGYGISLGSSEYNAITGNTCQLHTDTDSAGIHLSSSNHNTITGNICSGNYYGILLVSSDYNSLKDNTCSTNSDSGINLSNSGNTTIENNTLSGNGNSGIYLDSNVGASNKINYNNIWANTAYGVFLVPYEQPENNIDATYNWWGHSSGLTWLAILQVQAIESAVM